MTAIDNAKTEDTTIVLLQNIIDKLLEEPKNNLIKMYDFKNQIWFWKKIMKKNLLKYLEIASDSTLAASAKSLLYAFRYPGTREGLIQLAHGIFGSFSIVFVEDDNHPAVLSLRIQNANDNFYTAYAVDRETTLTTEDRNFVLAMLDMKRMALQDTLNFFKMFLTPGRVLTKITINEDR